MKVIGLIGFIGVGKGTVAEYLKKDYSYEIITMGDIVRELATKLGRSHSRDDLQGTQREYTAKHGLEYFVKRVIKKIKENKLEKVVVDGIRRPEDVGLPKKTFSGDMIVLQIDAEPAIRFERMKARCRTGDPQTFEEFQRQEANEFKLFNYTKTLEYVEFNIENNNRLEDLYKQIDDLVHSLGFD